MKILYCGDSPVGGPSNYLLGILRSIDAETTHISPGVKLDPKILNQRFDAIILSDYGYDCLPEKAEEKMIYQILSGTGLLMVGGWGSFAGPFGGWQKSEVAKLLPVECSKKDDRVNLGSGLYVFKKENHPVIKGLDLKNAPVLIGLNALKAKKSANVALTARAFQPSSKKFTGRDYPLLVLSSDPEVRTAAFATDFAPHWCGGLVDWGKKRCKLPVAPNIGIEVGDQYVRLIAQIVKWTAGRLI